MPSTMTLFEAPAVTSTPFWPEADHHAFAAYERLLGRQESVESGGIYWRAVRPSFYRPLLPYQPLSIAVPPPRTAWWGGYQHAVHEGEHFNTYLNILLFDNTPSYSIETLDYNRRRQVRKAEATFTIRVMNNVDEFKEKAHRVYVDFYQRTRYAYGARRQDRHFFDQWAHSLFGASASKLVILGGYQGDKLGGVSVSLRIGDTVLYAMFFCDNDSLQRNLSDLMLHTVRTEAARCDGVRQIYAGMSRAENDRFYLLRGCRRVQKPAWLQLNPLIEHMLRLGAPRMYIRMLGTVRGTIT